MTTDGQTGGEKRALVELGFAAKKVVWWCGGAGGPTHNKPYLRV